MTLLQFDSYRVYLDRHLLDSKLLADLCQELNKRIVIVTDSHLQDLYGKPLQISLDKHGISAEMCVFEAGEQHKTRETKQKLEDWLLGKQYSRDTCLLALGGGVVTDLVGFLAATYCRGIPVIYLPTTLLAMIDASMGGKTGVNTPQGKNLVGTFTQPRAIGMDTATLQTLPDREWRNGIVEMIKHGLVSDASLFSHMQETTTLSAFKERTDLLTLIQRNCEIKQSIVSQDEHEHHMRQLLNFGHTIGHAIETLEGYEIAHGEAVAIGMLVECYIALLAGYLSEDILNAVDTVLRQYDLPLHTQVFSEPHVFMEAMNLDKKSIRSVPRFVLLQAVGKPHVNSNLYVHTVSEQQLKQALEWAAVKFGTT